MTVRGCFGLGTAHVKVLGEWKKKEENEDDETRFFTVSRFVTLVTV